MAKIKKADALALANKQIEKCAAELLIAKRQLAVKDKNKEKRSQAEIDAYKELVYQNKEKEKRAAELLIANKELLFQNAEKEKRAAELIIANKELAFQNTEKEKRAAELITANIKKEEAEKYLRIIEEKNKCITDSINYAKYIQEAKLPEKKEIYSALSDCFILFKPKDIVSGDFYFFHKTRPSLFIAAADCTGHGVPGALMSMISSEKLNAAVSQNSNLSEILKQVNTGIKISFRQSENNKSSRDGMDIALCSVNTEKRIVNFAGANRPLWIIRKGQTTIEEIKGTKTAIGGFTDDSQHFESHEVKLQQGDTFYIFSDGYASTFGGQDGKKLKTKTFKRILLDIQHKSMRQQEHYLNTFIENWKSGEEQVDDILVIGIRL